MRPASPTEARQQSCSSRCDAVGCSVDGGAGVEHGAVGSGPGGDPIGCHRQAPAAFVHQVMVFARFAQWAEIVEVCRSAVFPGDDVVDPAVIEGDGAGRVHAGRVHRPQGLALGGCRQPGGTSDIHGASLAVEHDRDDLGVTGQLAHGRDRQGLSVGELAHRVGMQPVAQGLFIDEHDQFHHPLADLTTRHGVDHGFDLQLVPGHLAVAGLAAELAAGAVDPGPQLGVTDRVERDQRVAHPRLAIGPALDLRQLPLLVQLVGIGLAGRHRVEMPCQITTRSGRTDRHLTARRLSTVRHPRPRTRLWSVRRGCGSHRRWRRHDPADTVPAAKASSNAGITMHTRSRSSAVRASLPDWRPSRANRSRGASPRPCSANWRCRRVTRTLTASTHAVNCAICSVTDANWSRSITSGSAARSAANAASGSGVRITHLQSSVGLTGGEVGPHILRMRV